MPLALGATAFEAPDARRLPLAVEPRPQRRGAGRQERPAARRSGVTAGELNAPDLEELMARVAGARDRAAFGLLFDHFAPRLKAFLLQRGSDGATAEEVVQEAMLTVWRKAESFDRRQATVSTWIFTVARNKRIDRLRRERRPPEALDDPMQRGRDDDRCVPRRSFRSRRRPDPQRK